jgi:hypothetical protein
VYSTTMKAGSCEFLLREVVVDNRKTGAQFFELDPHPAPNRSTAQRAQGEVSDIQGWKLRM